MSTNGLAHRQARTQYVAPEHIDHDALAARAFRDIAYRRALGVPFGEPLPRSIGITVGHAGKPAAAVIGHGRHTSGRAVGM